MDNELSGKGKLTQLKMVTILTEWIKHLEGILACAEFKGVVVLELHLDVAKGSCVIHQTFQID